MITFDHLTYGYPDTSTPVLQDISLEIDEGDFVLVVGPSGSGKSTLLRCLNGLVPHFYGGEIAGSVRVGDDDPVALEPRRMSKRVGFCFQDPESQFVVDTVESELVFAMENHNVPQSTMRKRVEEVLDQLNIAHLRRRRISTLSGGEKQRVAIASVLTLEPQVLVLDEPTSQLDPQAAEEVLTALQKLNADLGLTIILSEHRLERIVQYVDSMIYMPGQGAPLICGSPQDVLQRIDLVPPLAQLGKALDWQPLPLTIRDARRFARRISLSSPNTNDAGSSDTRPSVDVAIRDLWYAYDGHPALNGINVEICQGECVAIMGRNGSGKTTLLKHLVGLIRPDKGSILINDMDTRHTELDDIIRTVGYVPQNPDALLFADTVSEELTFTRRNHGLPDSELIQWLEPLGLDDKAEMYPRDLSVGERQRVALASILAGEPRIILLDEPTRGIDYGQKQAIIDYIALEKGRGHTVILSTHDVELAAAAVDRVIILGDGEVVVDGSTREVMSESMIFSSQINKLFRSGDYAERRYLTVDDVLEDL